LIYVDTSALAKAYLAEGKSRDVDDFLTRESGRVVIGELAILEMRCAIARRTRDQTLAANVAARTWATFQSDVAEGHFEMVPHHPDDFQAATRMIEMVAPLPVKALDALHLVFARRAAVSQFASADKQQLAAAEALGFTTISFVPETISAVQ
jgi:uncharacterized protein